MFVKLVHNDELQSWFPCLQAAWRRLTPKIMMHSEWSQSKCAFLSIKQFFRALASSADGPTVGVSNVIEVVRQVLRKSTLLEDDTMEGWYNFGNDYRVGALDFMLTMITNQATLSCIRAAGMYRQTVLFCRRAIAMVRSRKCCLFIFDIKTQCFFCTNVLCQIDISIVFM